MYLSPVLFLCFFSILSFFLFFFNDTATTEIYTLSLHDALPISPNCMFSCLQILEAFLWFVLITLLNVTLDFVRSEERFSRNAETDLVCRLLLEKKKKNKKYFHVL